jgi:hypothetical protein
MGRPRKFKIGERVALIETRKSYFLPPLGVIGEVVGEGKHPNRVLVQWPRGSTAGEGLWFCLESRLMSEKSLGFKVAARFPKLAPRVCKLYQHINRFNEWRSRK